MHCAWSSAVDPLCLDTEITCTVERVYHTRQLQQLYMTAVSALTTVSGNPSLQQEVFPRMSLAENFIVSIISTFHGHPTSFWHALSEDWRSDSPSLLLKYPQKVQTKNFQQYTYVRMNTTAVVMSSTIQQ